jgi:hypothetical protein
MARAMAVETAVTMLMFEDQDSLNEPAYMTRLLLTNDYLRIDDGEDHGDFALLDREDGTVFSVSHEDAGGVPDVGGNKVSRYYMFTNGKRCMEVYAVTGFYDDAVNALTELSNTLAGQHAKGLEFIPDEARSDCDLANNIFVPDRHLSKGFPIRQKDFAGRTRKLVTVKDDVMIDSSIFELPEGYERFMPGAISQ